MMEHKTVSLADQVFEKLEKDILSGVYPRGEILTESRLSSELGVSRTPVREALRRLEQEHIIEDTGKGAIVIGITEKDLTDIFMIRKYLEGLAASLAAQNRTEEQLNELREALEFQEFYLQKRNAEQIKQLDSRFHTVMYQLSGSNAFYDTLVPLHKKIQRYRRVSVENNSRAEASVAEHQKIFDAIARQDAVAAEQSACEHVENAYRHMFGKD